MRPWTERRKRAKSKRYKANPPNPGTRGERAVGPQDYGEKMARYGNNNPTSHGLESKLVQEFRRLERIYLKDPNNVVKLDAVEEARVRAVRFVENLIRAGIRNPAARVTAMHFVVRQTVLCTHRTEGKSCLKGNRWAL